MPPNSRRLHSFGPSLVKQALAGLNFENLIAAREPNEGLSHATFILNATQRVATARLFGLRARQQP